MDALRYVPIPMEAICAVATLDIKSLSIAELVWVRTHAVRCLGLTLQVMTLLYGTNVRVSFFNFFGQDSGI